MDLEFLVGLIANVFGAVGGFYAVYHYFESQLVRLVPVHIRCNGKDITSFSIPKSQFSRAEVIGRVDMIAKVPRVSVSALTSPKTIDAIDAVTMGDKLDLVINITEEETSQF